MMRSKYLGSWTLPALVLAVLAGCLGKMDRSNPFDPSGTGALPDGLVFSWLFEDGFKEIRGRNDFNNITDVITKSGNRGLSLKINDYAGVAISSKPFTPNPNKGFTVEFWLLIREKKDPAASPPSPTYYRIVSSRNGPGTEGWWFEYGDAYDAGPVTVRFGLDGGSGIASAAAPMGAVATGWFHVAGVYQPDIAPNATVQLYIQGSLINSDSHIRASFDALNPIEIGQAQGGTSGTFELDTLQVWDFPLTPAEVNRVKVGELP